MNKLLTIVLEFPETEDPSVTIGSYIDGGLVVAAQVGNAVGEVFALEERLQQINGLSTAQIEMFEERDLVEGNVIRLLTGVKKMVKGARPMIEGEEFICENPHEDEDYSYLCGSNWCRCCQ